MKKLLDFLACNDRYDLKKLLAKLKQKSMNSTMKYDPILLLHLSVFLISVGGNDTYGITRIPPVVSEAQGREKSGSNR